jgi:UDP-glucose 4-epimerase
MNLLVTGGAGYIGSVVAAELAAAGHDVVVYDNLSHGRREAVPRQAELVIGDLADAACLQNVFRSRDFDAVLHFAALIEAGESMRVPERYFRNNSVNTLTLLETMLAAGVGKIVFSSTAAVYGEPEKTPIPETHPLRPANAYGQSKLFVENMLEWFNRIHGLRYASLRYFNAAGAAGGRGEAHDPESHLIPLVLQAAAGRRPAISIFGEDYPTADGTCIRDYVHVLDLAAAHLLALEALDQRPKLIYNLGNGQGFSVREVIAAAELVTGREIPVRHAERRPGDPAILIAGSDKIRQELHWSPAFSRLEDILSSAWNWTLQFGKAEAREATMVSAAG